MVLHDATHFKYRMKSVAVIIPIYKLSDYRFDNFCFIIKQFYGLLHLCDVYVVEQVSNSSSVQVFLQKYPKIKYLSLGVGDVFNKSKLINYGTLQSDSDYIWMVDADFYTDYECVLESVDAYTEFVRPFNKTIILNEHETEGLRESGYVRVSRDKYTTNITDGKFSFIVNRDIFAKSQMMNEDYHGWGFQDLDFIKNRLVDCTTTSLDIVAFHLYHKSASKQYVNRNKRMFLNLSPTEKLPEETKHEEEMLIDTSATKVVSKIPTQISQNPVSQPEKQTTKIKPIRRDITHIHHKVGKSNMFSAYKETYVIDDSNKNITQRDISGRIKNINQQSHFMLIYLEYIIKNYEGLAGLYLFSTDFFSKSFSIFGHEEVKKIKDCLEHGIEDFPHMRWLTKTQILKLSSGHANIANDKSKYKFDKWVSLYTKNSRSLRPKYSMSGCFIVNSKSIKKHPIEYYRRILNQTPTWTEEDYLFYMASLQNIFT
jgi:hypothetical protein